MRLSVLIRRQLVALPGVKPEVHEAPAALVAEQAIGVLVEHTEPAVAVLITDVHSGHRVRSCSLADGLHPGGRASAPGIVRSGVD